MRIRLLMENFNGAVRPRGLYKWAVRSIDTQLAGKIRGGVVCVRHRGHSGREDQRQCRVCETVLAEKNIGSVVCDGRVNWIAKCALRIELRCGVSFGSYCNRRVESGSSLAMMLQG